MLGDAISAGPLVRRKMICAEEPIEERKMNREIHVNRILVDPMMPVMKPRRGQETPDVIEIPSDIGVQER